MRTVIYLGILTADSRTANALGLEQMSEGAMTFAVAFLVLFLILDVVEVFGGLKR